jgi:hypothetical protein
MSGIFGARGGFKIEVDGADELAKLLQNLPDEAIEATRKELQRACADLKGKAQNLAPVDTGDLRGSAFYETEAKDGGLEATIGFTAPYATRQHEEVGYNHPHGGQAKYLEEPFKQNVGKYTDKIGEAIKRAVEHPE